MNEESHFKSEEDSGDYNNKIDVFMKESTKL